MFQCGVGNQAHRDPSVLQLQPVANTPASHGPPQNTAHPLPAKTKQDLCKLEIMRQDKTFEWYEVRSSMRLAWLKAKQMIIPVEVICSFQQMHTDSPAGSANSIVARLQRVSWRKGKTATL